jgi:universal stress protein A
MMRYRNILLLLDLTTDSEHIVAAGRDLAAASGAQLIALHVVEFLPVEPLGEVVVPMPDVEQELIKHAKNGLAALLQRTGVAARSRVESGNTKAEILRVANEEQADLIVLGSRERHGLAILVNFTEDTVLHAAHCDVLAVRLK